MENPPFEDVFPIQDGYVSFREGVIGVKLHCCSGQKFASSFPLDLCTTQVSSRKWMFFVGIIASKPGDSKWPFWVWWKRDPSKGLSGLQLRDEKVTLNHLEYETKTMDGGRARA